MEGLQLTMAKVGADWLLAASYAHPCSSSAAKSEATVYLVCATAFLLFQERKLSLARTQHPELVQAVLMNKTGKPRFRGLSRDVSKIA